MGSHSVAVRLEVGVGSKMAAVKTICKFLLYSMLISAVFCDSTEDFLSNYEEAEDEHNSQIASDNATYSETSTHSGNSEPYLDMDVMTDEELQEAVTKQSLDDPENLNEVTSTKSPDIKSLNNESEKKETMEAFENKHDLSRRVKRSSDDVDKIPETTTTSSDTNGDDVIEYTDGGVACKSKCEKNGQEYFWCWQITGSWDYCIPAVVPTISTTTETTTITTTKKPTTSETTTTESSTTTTEFLTTTTKPTTTMKSSTTTTEPTTTTTEPTTTTTESTTTTLEPTTTETLTTKTLGDKVVEYTDNGVECKS